MQEGQFKRVILNPKVIGLIVLVVAVIVGVHLYNNHRESVARRPETYGAHFIQLLTEKDGSTTYGMFNSTAKKKVSESDWNQWVVFAFDKYDGGTPQLSKKDTVPDPGHLYSSNSEVVRLRYNVKNQGKTGIVELILTQDGMSWKVAQAGLAQ